ncbi:MAG: hypothetical protein JXM70_12335 [Pirellulales bacterium]|nr:hypothetical protein [Pirellulales bacterium]
MVCIKRALMVLVAIVSTCGFTAMALADTLIELPSGYDSGWTLVRRVAPGSANSAPWHPAQDHLAGTQVYDNGPDAPSETGNVTFSIDFETTMPGWNEVLLITGDRERWMIMSKSEIQKYGANVPFSILATNYPGNPSSALMYHRPPNPEDPWLSPVDHSTAIGAGWILYGANSYDSDHGRNILPYHNGANVFIRTIPEPSTLAMLLCLGGIGLGGYLGSKRGRTKIISEIPKG